MANVTVSLRMSPRETDVVRLALQRLLHEAKGAEYHGLTEDERRAAGYYAGRLLVELDDFRNEIPPKLVWEDKVPAESVK